MPATDFRSDRGLGFWWAMLFALILVIFGLPILAGGVWLISLGGSWYYAPAGLGLLVTAYFLFRRSMIAVWIYLLVFAGTLAWALWEAGFNGWAQVPRLVAPTVILVLMLITIPALRGARGLRHSAVAAGIAGFFALGTAGAVLIASQDHPVIAQEAQTPAPAPEAEPAPPPATPAEPAAPAEPAPTEPAAPPAAAAASVQYAMLQTGADWPAYGGTHHATRYSPLEQITPENVATLERVWEYRTGSLPEGDEAFAAETTPLKIGNRVFLCSAMGDLIALDAGTGAEAWRFDAEVPRDYIPYNATCRGVSYFETPGAAEGEFCARRVIGATLNANLIAVDAETGQACTDFGTDGRVDLNEGIGESAPGFYSVTSPVTIVRDVAVVGAQVLDGQRREAPSGVVRGYNVITGELEWAWDMLREGETGAPEGDETYSPGTPNMWTIASGDNELGLVYAPLGNSAVDYWGGDRTDIENRYSTSIVAIDVETGTVAWHFQTVHYDIWDYDLGSQASLVDFPTEAGPVPAMILPTKQGQFFILDRATGEPLSAVEEVEVPVTGGVEDPARMSPTQPASVDFPDLVKDMIEEKHMWGMTPLDQLWCRIQYRQAHYEGPYTPPTVGQRWIQYPGYNGGSDWGGVAIDEGRNVMVANYNDMPNHNRLVERGEVDRLGIVPIDEAGGAGVHSHDSISPQAGAPYGIDVNAGWRMPFTKLLCKEPPYGGIAAIDLTTKQVLWDKPFGTARKNGPFGIPTMLPFDIGTPNNGGAVVTASGLVFIAAATDDLIRAIDIETGEVLWEDELPAGGQATPMTYEYEGRQYLGFMAGGHNFMETPIGDYVIAYALPEAGGGQP
jgi:quinoprotein glucose dehydrogenase